MIRLTRARDAWGQADFADTLKQELMEYSGQLPLQAGLAAGSYAKERLLDVILISTHESDGAILAKVGIFYESLTPGCACAGDPTVESEQNEYLVIQVDIDVKTAETAIQLLDD